ncbi:MAG: response regulator transcription factor [bacterium]|jgi:DNA-binding response OmpR family regulator|nr:response regulator transcription factor [bacterium]
MDNSDRLGGDRVVKPHNGATRSNGASLAGHTVLLGALESEVASLLIQALGRSSIEASLEANIFDVLYGEADTYYDCLILGGNLEDIQELRGLGQQVPILSIVLDPAPQQRITALKMGADDCLSVPFAVGELVARVQALCRRSGALNDQDAITVGTLTLCSENHTVERDGRTVRLSPTEGAILRLLMERPGHVVSADRISTAILGECEGMSSNLVSVHIANLRRKLGSCSQRSEVQTVRGKGYLVRVP